MQLSSDVRIPDGILAENALLAENSRQGFGASTHTLYQGFSVAISSTPLGIINPLYDGRVRSRYTGKERDSESGLDYFGARYYASSMGRWMSPDWADKPETVPYSDLANPQSLNLYSYVGNRPTSGFDPYGHLDCSGGAGQDVACAVTTAAKAVWHFLSGSGDSSSTSSTNTQATAAPDPIFNVTSRIMNNVSSFNQRYAPNYSGVGWSGSHSYGLGYGAAASIGNDLLVYNSGNGNTFAQTSNYGYTGMHYQQPGGVAFQTHDDDTVFGLGAGIEAHATFGRNSGDIFGTSSSPQSALNIGIVNAGWSHSEGWTDYQFSVGIGPTGFSYTQMHSTTVTTPF